MGWYGRPDLEEKRKPNTDPKPERAVVKPDQPKNYTAKCKYRL